jgi:ATP-dependent exoDNAse (exonuclease V) alpha subunit
MQVEIHPLFPLEHTTAITVHKSQGRTLGQVVLALAHKRGMKCNMEYTSVYVALNRVRKKEDIRLLLTEKSVTKRLMRTYLADLKPDKSIRACFEG